MTRKHLDFDDYLTKTLKNKAIRREYDRLQPEFAVINALIEARQEKGVTQGELARRMGTTQSAIARLESGNANPSLNFLHRVAQALSAQLEVRFIGGRTGST